MSIIRLTLSLAITNDHNNRRFILDNYKPSNKLYYVSCFNGAATRSCSTSRLKALQTGDVQRRSGNYRPPFSDNTFVQSLCSEYKEERYLEMASELMAQLKKIIISLDDEMTDVVQQLEFIDDLLRLDISYHFVDEINQILNRIYAQEGCKNYDPTDLYSTALRFRLLRQHGFRISQDVFDCFKNEEGDFKASLGDATKGLLQLYEASFLSTQGEETMDLARGFAAKFLREKINGDHGGQENTDDEHVGLLVHKALELPFHWRVPRLNARWSVNVYERRANMNPIVLEFAKLDFNIVQATHQQEFKHVSSWWEQTGLAEKLPFARNMLMEFYVWSFFGPSEPKCSYIRIMITKFAALITVIDDMFDVYGTIQELELFNDAIRSWDVEAIDKLPEYMQICFLALNNFVDEMAYHVLKEQGSLIITHLRKSWADLCESYLRQAKWYSEGYKPKLEEYLSDACTESSGFVQLSHTFFLVTNPIEKESVQSLYNFHDIVLHSGLILRLANDLGTSADEMERGDNLKSVQCYMNETGASVEEAREHVKFMIDETWKKLNEQVLAAADSPFQPEFVRIAVGFARIAHYAYYNYQCEAGAQYAFMKDNFLNFLVQPIPYNTIASTQ